MSKIPGPFFDTFFDMPILYYNLPLGTRYERTCPRGMVKTLTKSCIILNTAHRYHRMIELHQKYGRIVRSTNRTIIISDKHMIKQILHDDDLPKAWSYKNLQCKAIDTAEGKSTTVELKKML
jgi:hypothetical protein